MLDLAWGTSGINGATLFFSLNLPTVNLPLNITARLNRPLALATPCQSGGTYKSGNETFFSEIACKMVVIMALDESYT